MDDRRVNAGNDDDAPQPFAYQVGGHHATITKNGEWLVKSLPPNIKGVIERAFYDQVNSDTRRYQTLLSFLPDYRAGTGRSLVLGDLTAGYGRPCVIDIKMGTQTFDEDANVAKQRHEADKYPHQSLLGLRVTGYQRWLPVSDRYDRKAKHYGRTLEPHQLPSVIGDFLSSSHCQCVARSWLCRLQSLAQWFEQQREFRFYASSILFVYDGEHHTHDCSMSVSHSSETECAACANTRCRMTMIDFGHVFGAHRRRWLESDGSSGHGHSLSTTVHSTDDHRRDDGYIHGINTLIRTLQSVAFTAACQSPMSTSTAMPISSPQFIETSPKSQPLLSFGAGISLGVTLVLAVLPTISRPLVVPNGHSLAVDGKTTVNPIDASTASVHRYLSDSPVSLLLSFPSSPLQSAVLALLALVLVYLRHQVSRPLIFRKLLTPTQRERALRKSYYDVPFPFPKCWYELCHQWELTCEQPVTVTVLNRTLTLTRSSSIANTAECVDESGHRWPVVELNRAIYVWHACDGSEPAWEMPCTVTDQFHGDAWRLTGFTEHEVNCHHSEISENGADFQHFPQLHGEFVVNPLRSLIKHRWRSTWTQRAKPEQHLVDLTIAASTSVCGLALPHCLNVSTKVLQIGPSIVHVTFALPLIGQAVMIETVTPITANVQRVRHTMFSQHAMPALLAKFLLYNAVRQFERDFVVWNHKQWLRSPLVVREDGPLLAFRRWMRQFSGDIGNVSIVRDLDGNEQIIPVVVAKGNGTKTGSSVAEVVRIVPHSLSLNIEVKIDF